MQALATHKDGWNSSRRSSFDAMDRDLRSVEEDVERNRGIEARVAEGRSFERSPRPIDTGAERSGNEQRSRLNRAMQSYMLRGQVDAEYRDILTTTSSGASLIPQAYLPELQKALKF